MLCGKVLAPLSRAALQSRVIGFPNGGRVFAIIKALGRQPSMHNISQARFYRTSPCILKRRENAFDDVEGGRRYRRGNEYEDNQDGYPMQERKKRRRKTGIDRQAHLRKIEVSSATSFQYLTDATGKSIAKMIKDLKGITGRDYNPRGVVDREAVEVLAELYGIPLVDMAKELDVYQRDVDEEEMATWPRKPPVVTIMGHVDHGKTTLLDKLRNSNVVAGEAGGITQHIAAFSVETPGKHHITFIDTPGHEAFYDMRSRGADVTDIVILVVSANEGVKKQTMEALQHAQKAGVPIIVAINKIDLPDADPARVRTELLSAGVELEESGGDVQVVEISAKNGTNFDRLEDAILTQAELSELRGDPTGPTEGVIIESRVEKGKGNVSTALITRGTLRPGAHMVAGTVYGKARMLTRGGGNLKEVLPGEPCDIIGWKEPPLAGMMILEVESEARANEVIKFRDSQVKIKDYEAPAYVRPSRRSGKEDVPSRNRKLKDKLERGRQEAADIRAGVTPTTDEGASSLPIVLKGDVLGTVEALQQALSPLQNQHVYANVIHSGIGPVTESDVLLAANAGGIIVLFNTSCPKSLEPKARQSGVTILSSPVIYHLINDVKKELSERMPEREVFTVKGKAVVHGVFDLTGRNAARVAGLRVEDGLLKKNALFRVIRGGETLWTGPAVELKHNQDNITQISKGNECGLHLDGFEDFEKGDVIECCDVHTERPEFVPYGG